MIARGTVVSARSGLLEAILPCAGVGAGVRVRTALGTIRSVVTAVRGSRVILAPHDAIEGVRSGDVVETDRNVLFMPLGASIAGRALDAGGNALDASGPLRGRRSAVEIRAPGPQERDAITQPFWTGVRSIDGLLSIGRGARIGVFGPPGTGKSSLLQLFVRGSHADAISIALVGERGRESEEWIRTMPAHATIVCATSDRPAAQRIRAAVVAMAQASALRDRGLHVLLILDSLARYAGALREIAVGSGEAVGRAGYPPSVFAELARYVETAGTTARGSITLLATVLSDGDERDPVSDCARSLLDGHIQLSTQLAQAGRYPAIDLLSSTSRTMEVIASARQIEDARAVRAASAFLSSTADARALGIAPTGAYAERVIAAEDALEAFLRQGPAIHPPQATLSALHDLADRLR